MSFDELFLEYFGTGCGSLNFQVIFKTYCLFKEVISFSTISDNEIMLAIKEYSEFYRPANEKSLYAFVLGQMARLWLDGNFPNEQMDDEELRDSFLKECNNAYSYVEFAELHMNFFGYGVDWISEKIMFSQKSPKLKKRESYSEMEYDVDDFAFQFAHFATQEKLDLEFLKLYLFINYPDLVQRDIMPQHLPKYTTHLESLAYMIGSAHVYYLASTFISNEIIATDLLLYIKRLVSEKKIVVSPALNMEFFWRGVIETVYRVVKQSEIYIIKNNELNRLQRI